MLWLLVAVAALLGPAGEAHRAATPGTAPALEARDRFGPPTDIAADGDTAAYSAYDASTRRFRLVLARGGDVRRAPVAPRAVPFDVDVGRGPDGAPLVVYARCARESYDTESSTARVSGCSLRVLDPATGRERVVDVGGDAREPAVSGRRVAFLRAGKPHVAPLAGGRARRVGGSATPRDLDISGAWLATLAPRRGAAEVRVQPLAGGSSWVVLRRPTLVGLGFDGDALGFARVCESVKACQGVAYRYAAGALERAPAPATLFDFALGRGRGSWVDAPGGVCGCVVKRGQPLRFRPVG